MIKRKLTDRLLEDSNVFRILNVKGARQTGKTTLVKQLVENKQFRYFTFDKKEDYDFAKNTPVEFVNQANNYTVIIDEIQKIPDILPYLKMQVDENNTPGQFILTGSADMLKMKQVHESLAGRKIDYDLMSFSLAEIHNVNFNIIDLIVENNVTKIGTYFDNKNDIIFNQAVKGGFPEIQNYNFRQRKNWFKSYVTSRIIKDIDDITDGTLHKLELMPKMLRYLAWQAGDLLNYSSVSKELGIGVKTVKSYLHFLETLFLTEIIQPYYINLGKRQIKTPKFYFSDSGLLAYFLNVDTIPISNFSGKIMENFILCELLKNNTVAENQVDFFYYRDKMQFEVDIILEINPTELVAVEVKLKEEIKDADLKGIRRFKRLMGDKLVAAYVFYGGKLMRTIKTEGDLNVVLVPFSALLG